jgi:hypothetical protein
MDEQNGTYTKGVNNLAQTDQSSWGINPTRFERHCIIICFAMPFSLIWF